MMNHKHNLTTTLGLAAAMTLSAGCSAALTVSVDVYDGARPIPLAYQIAFANKVLDRPYDLTSTIDSLKSEADEQGLKTEKIIASNIARESRASAQVDDGSPPGGRLELDACSQDECSPSILARDFLLCTSRADGDDDTTQERRRQRRSRRRAKQNRQTYDACADEFMALRYAVASQPSVTAQALNKTKSLLVTSNPEKKNEIEEILAHHVAPWEASGIAAGGSVDGRVVGTPLFDPMVGALARGSSPLRREIRTLDVNRKVEWIPFSRSRFSAHGGNSQFVVVREGHLVFRQKSLDFDPTPVVGAGVATSKLGLKVASAVLSSYGITVPTADGADSGGDTESGLDPEGLQQVLDARRAQSRAFVGRLANLYKRLEDQELSPEQLTAIRAELTRELELFSAQ